MSSNEDHQRLVIHFISIFGWEMAVFFCDLTLVILGTNITLRLVILEEDKGKGSHSSCLLLV
jgi:hypothetical protein